MTILRHVKRIFKRLQKTHEWNKQRRLSDHRASSLAVKLALSGALKTSRRGVTVIGRARA
jgi:hypothetical protein